MRKIVFLLLLAFSSPVFAQQDTGSVVIPRSALTVDQKALIEQQVLKTKIETYGEWVGLGKEIGEAVNSSLSAVTEHTTKFAETKVGKMTMAIVIWKVVGNDLLGVLFAIAMWLAFFPLFVWSFRKNALPYEVKYKEDVDDTGKVTNRYYEHCDKHLGYTNADSRAGYAIVHTLIFLIMLFVTAIAVF